MKKILFVVLGLFAFAAGADNTITSKEYVDGQVATLQTQIPAKNTNTVVTNTDTAGTVGEKAIYDTTAAYGAQSDALVTAGAFNSAVQNALESEFVCVEWQGSVHDNAHCLLYEVRAATQMQPLPSGYTQLEYIYFDGTHSTGAYINTDLTFSAIPNDKIKFEVDVKVYPSTDAWQIIVGSNGSTTAYIGTNDNNRFYYGAGDGDKNTGVTNPYARCFHRFDTVNKTYNINNLANNSQIIKIISFDTIRKSSENPILIGGFANSSESIAPYRAQMDLYSIKIYNDAVLAFNGIPCKRDSDGIVGLYDTVSETFKTNAMNTNTLAAGPVASYLPQNQ